ncbi:MAG: peptidoglycan DD-metalloendopeptidase family protein [Kiloniellaceae bacterium]
MAKAFVPREVFFRSGDRFHHFRISVRAQKLAAALGVAILGWGLYASGSYVVQRSILASKEAEIERHKLAYFDLLAEVGEYHNQFAKITKDLEENQAYLLSLLEQNPEGRRNLATIQSRLKSSQTEHARVVLAREGLRQKMAQFESDLREIAQRNISLQSQVAKMQALVKSSTAERDQVAAARERLVRRLAKVERELGEATAARQDLEQQVAGLREQLSTSESERERLVAGQSRLNARIASLDTKLSEASDRQSTLKNRIAGLSASLAQAVDRNVRMERQRDYLERRVGGLEQRLVDLRDAGQSVIERLSERTRLSIDIIEKTIKMTGLEANTLLAGALDRGLGQGGPFVPAADEAAEFGPSLQLEASVTMLDHQLDRWGALQDVVRSLPLSAPLDQYRISSRFGKRRDPVNGRKAKHLGVDFASWLRAPIYATAPGKVVFAGWRGRYGRTVEIDHGYGIRTRYGHMRKILVKVGQEVGNREKIGLVGNSGRSTGPHVHYEVRYKGRAQNPMKFLKAGKHVFKG